MKVICNCFSHGGAILNLFHEKHRKSFVVSIKLRIFALEQEQQQPIIDMVNIILQTKESNSSIDTQDIENDIDFLVYQLYGLTYDEVLIIDPETPITREEYGNPS